MRTKRLLLSLVAMVCVVSIFGALVSAGTYTSTVSYSMYNKNPLFGKSSANTKITKITGLSNTARTLTTFVKIKNNDGTWATDNESFVTDLKTNFGSDTAKNGSATATSDSTSQKTSYHYFDMWDDEYSTGGEVTYYKATSTSGTINVG